MTDMIEYNDINDPSLQQYESSLNKFKGWYNQSSHIYIEGLISRYFGSTEKVVFSIKSYFYVILNICLRPMIL